MKHAQPPKIYTVIIVLVLGAMILGGCASSSPTIGAQGPQVNLSKIEPRDADGKTEITIEGAEPILQYTSFQLNEPLRLVIDISDANIGNLQEKMAVNSGGITDITLSQKDTIARVEIALAQAVETKVYQSGGKLMVELSKPAPPVEEPKPASAEPAAPPVVATPEPPPVAPAAVPAVASQPEVATATVISSVKAYAGQDGVKVLITADGTMKTNASMVGNNKLVIDIPGVKSRVKPSVIPVRKGGLDKVRVGQHPEKVRIVLDLKKALEYTVIPEGNMVTIAMGAAAVAAKAEATQPQERAAQQPAAAAAPVEKEVAATQEAAPPVPAIAAAKEIAEPKKKEAGGGVDNLYIAGGSRFSGRKISLDLQDADLINVMRLFAEVANLNIVLSPDVKGKVTVRMVNVPWDQAMEMVLKMNGLGYALDENILRIATVAALTKEAEEEMKAKEAKKKAEDLITRIIPVNYASVNDPTRPGGIPIENALKKSLSPRGDITPDPRTNTLIVKDIAKNVDEIVALVKLLDKPNPQVMIEARIVEARLNFSRDIGVQWGGQFTASAATGNPTGVVFPSSVGLTGPNNLGAVPSGFGNYMVNMPARVDPVGGGAGVGFSFGSLSKALNLDLVLSALEATGEGKIISTPRISALENREAKIEQGFSIPYSTVSANGTETKFIDAKLSLTVTPHITPDNKIFMKIKATKNAPDASVTSGTGQPSIRLNEAVTEILLSDGETAVIGGILQRTKTDNVFKVPWLGDIPLIGWFFRHTVVSEEKNELIIFITPRVVRQEVV